MPTPEQSFQKIVETFTTAYPDVTPGKMMHSPALKCKGKVFAFFWNDQMTFKLGKDRDLTAEYGIDQYDFLNPFKNKPPMKGWYVISHSFAERWPELTEEALSQMRGLSSPTLGSLFSE